MLTFVLVTALLAVLIAAVLVRPLLRTRDDQGPARLTAVVTGLVLLAGGGALYAMFSDYAWDRPAADAQTPASRAAALARKLARQPDDLQGWLELGDQYMEIEQFPLAARAYQRADSVANGRSAPAIIGLAEALMSIDFEEIRGRAGRLFERVLEIEPRNFKALFYGAVAALSRDDFATGRERFETLLALDPPENVRAIIVRQLQAIEAAQRNADANAASAGAANASVADAGAASGGAQVRVKVSMSPTLNVRTGERAALFVLARDPAQPGPPFAAKRLPVTFPVEVTLTAADAMLPQRRISAGQKLEVIARISRDGQPQGTSGDPFGQISYQVGKDGQLSLVIDRVTP
jgi:cytochrome c-type biogenesis protein CcmH